MNPTLGKHVENLKATLLSLPATGEKGFEGLIRETLRDITGVPFRLAGGGSQHGIDGRSAFQADAIGFECKLYSTPLDKDNVLARISEAPIKDPHMEVWVLGATMPVSAQLADLLRKRGELDGVSVLILDWATTGLPLLAVALAMGDPRVQGFLKTNIGDVAKLQEAVEALDAVRSSQDFASHAERITAECEATVSPGLWRKAG